MRWELLRHTAEHSGAYDRLIVGDDPDPRRGRGEAFTPTFRRTLR
jgi:hypothetical protein